MPSRYSKGYKYPSYYDGTIDDSTLDPELASSDSDGLMSKEDKEKLDSIKVSGGGISLDVKASNVTTDEHHKFVTEEQIKKWDTSASASSKMEYDEIDEALVIH